MIERTQTVSGRAVQFRRMDEPVGPFFLIGALEIAPGHIPDLGAELWRADGRWREDGQPHELDLAVTLPRIATT